jgi:hypothetical protein
MSRIVNGSEDICDGMVVMRLRLILSVFTDGDVKTNGGNDDNKLLSNFTITKAGRAADGALAILLLAAWS